MSTNPSNYATRQTNAEETASQLIHSWAEYGKTPTSDLPLDQFPNETLRTIAEAVSEASEHGIRGWGNVLSTAFIDAPEAIRSAFTGCCQVVSSPPSPEHCGPAVSKLRAFYIDKRERELGSIIARKIESGDPIEAELAELATVKEDTGKAHSLIVHGVNSYPTTVPPESVILGNDWMRKGDIANFVSTAGAGKSVAVTQAPMAWGLGLPYLGIRPARPLRILLFSGEDDGVTIGQCREGFLEHSEAITGRKLTAADLAPLDSMLRIEFIREHVGDSFHIHLARLLRESPADLVIINPLLSYLGGEVVATISTWQRAGLMPILQRHNCAALIAHHTGKMAKDGWENTDDTYSAIGGGEAANIPRSILTLRPTAADGLSVVKVSKRQTTGWKDADGNFTTSYFVKRSGNPERPAWIPVDSDEAQELMDASKPSGSAGKGGKKVTAAHVIEALETGAMQRQALIDWLMRKCTCSDRPARDAIRDAEEDGVISSFTEPNQKGGKPLRWFQIPESQTQWVA